MAHGFSAVKEMYLDRFAEVFAAAGLAALVFDNRNFGASDGEPRQEIDPWRQVRDYRDAITFAADACPRPIRRGSASGARATSGGHVLVLGAIDRRVKCVVSQVPLISGHRNARRLIRADHVAAVQRLFEADREARYAGEPPRDDRGRRRRPGRCRARCRRRTRTPGSRARVAARAPSWRNEVTLRSVEMFTEYEPGAYVRFISPTPLLMVVAAGDHLTVADEALAAYGEALEPKALALLPGGHFDAYVAGFEQASAPARDWFVRHLRP